MNSLVSLRLSVMMFLQFFIWGAWYVTAPVFLQKIGFTGPDIGWTYSVGPIAGIISPFFVGMIADRFFSTERVLAVMHLVGAAAMFGAISMMGGDNPSASSINLLFFGHTLCYYPTLALTNSLALHNMTDSEKQFPLIRVFGTIGWIVAGVVLSWQKWDGTVEMFYLTAGAALVMGLYSFTLPHTPPAAKGEAVSFREILGLDAFVMLRQKAFLVFMICSFLICIPLAFYYQMASRVVAQASLVPGFTMSFGQMSEIFFMLVMPLLFARLGVKWMLFVGMLAWVVRYALFALGAPDQVVWMIILGVVLHGICYDFFFVTGQIYTDKAAPKEIRSQAQGMLVLFTLGFGMLIGAQIGGQIEGNYTLEEQGRLNSQAAALGGRAKESLAKLAGWLQEDETAIRQRFDKLMEANENVYGVPPAPGAFDWLQELVVVTTDAPLEGSIKNADAAEAPLEEAIAVLRKTYKDEIAEIDKRVQDSKDAFVGIKIAATNRRARQLIQDVTAQLDAEADRLRKAAHEAVQPEIDALDAQRLPKTVEVAQQMIRDKISTRNASSQTSIDDDVVQALVWQAEYESLSKYSEVKSIRSLQAIDWKSIWTWPALGAGVIMLFFALTFRDNTKREEKPSGKDGKE